MKLSPRSWISGALALTVSASLMLTPLAAVIGTDLHVYDTPVHEGTVLSQGVYWGYSAQDKRTEHFITYTPGANVTPIVTYGDKIATTSTVSAEAKKLEAQGYRVVAGINGDFYYTGNGVPMGMVVTDGILRTGYNYTSAIGFREDGTAMMGDPKLSIKLSYTYTVEEPVAPPLPDPTVPVDPAVPETITREVTVNQSIYSINKARSNSGIFLYTNDFNRKGTTGNTEAGLDVVLVPTGDTPSTDFRIGQTLSFTVESVLQKTGATEVPAGKVVLSVNNKAPAASIDALKHMTPGASVSISVSAADPKWSEAKYITSGYKNLVVKGEVAAGLDTAGAPRTAIGQKADGSLIFYTIDGRQKGYSVGASEALLAQRLQQLGCVTAIGMDGGGSTTLTATLPDQLTSSVINRPSGGTERAVSTHIFLVADNKPSGFPDHYYVSPVSTQMLAGATLRMHTTLMDTNFIPMAEDDSHPVWSATGGTISESGIYTAPAEGGTYTVTYTNGVESGSATVEVVDAPDTLSAFVDGKKITSLTMPADQSYTIAMAAYKNHMTLRSQKECFTFMVTGDIGTITPDGVFTATKDGAGAIVVTAGTTSLTIPVTVKSMPFEDVPANAWYFDAVKYSYRNGLMQGASSTVFAPTTHTSRAMLVQILYNMEGRPETPYTGSFADVSEGQWYAGAVEWAAGQGIVSGTGSGFNPAGEVTREQVAVILRNYAAFKGLDIAPKGDLTAFSDADSTHDWAKDACIWAVDKGLLKGSSGALNPLGTATRAEIAQVLMNFDTVVLHPPVTPEPQTEPTEPELPADPDLPSTDDLLYV